MHGVLVDLSLHETAVYDPLLGTRRAARNRVMWAALRRARHPEGAGPISGGGKPNPLLREISVGVAG